MSTWPPGVNYSSPSQSLRSGMKGGRGGANALWDLSEGARCGMDILVGGTKLEGRFPPLMVADIAGGRNKGVPSGDQSC